VKSKLSNPYEVFILLLTVLSLLDTVALLLPWMAPATVRLLEIYDTVICVVFLFDFGLRITALLRLARISRLDRVIHKSRAEGGRNLTKDVLANRSGARRARGDPRAPHGRRADRVSGPRRRQTRQNATGRP
jgi:hypothetical protein